MKIDEDPFRNSDYWIISSNVYVKRENLNNDPSEWKGWEVHARTQKRDIFLILFRRKYLPPLMESYTEMVFALYGPENFTLTQKQAEEHILHKHKKTESNLNVSNLQEELRILKHLQMRQTQWQKNKCWLIFFAIQLTHYIQKEMFKKFTQK